MTDYFTGFEEEAGIRGLARSMNLRFVEEVDRQYWVDNPAGLPDLPLFKHGEMSNVADMCYGTFAGLPAQLFTFAPVSYPDDPGYDRRTCVHFSFRGNFPTLTVGPHTRLSRLQEKTKSPFTERYRVSGRDQDVAGVVLDDGMKHYLMGVDPQLRIEVGGGSLLGHTRETDAEQVPVLLQQVYGLYLHMPDAAWDRYGY
jgi:hypothetical protein